ncbi:MAG: hypothetical protein PHI63_01140 [Patescibacteria group bacterium]|nr:hypothetical protein [Patescibacteria group bacterium]
MFDTSRDILNMVLAVSAIVLTVFLTMVLYHVYKILRDASKVTTSFREKLDLVDKILNLVKDKLEAGASHLGLIADSALKIVGFFMERQGEKTSKSRRKKEEE